MENKIEQMSLMYRVEVVVVEINGGLCVAQDIVSIVDVWQPEWQ